MQRKMKTAQKLKQTRKAIKQFCEQTKKNFISMKKKIKKIWVILLLVTCSTVMLQSCNVTRVITNESQYYQKGDTSIVIQTKTTETYDASKKGVLK